MIIVKEENHEEKDIVQLDQEDLEAMRDDAKAIREGDYQQFKVYAWEQNLNRRFRVSNQVDFEMSSDYIYKTMRLFEMPPPEIYFLTKEQMGNGNWAGVARGTSVIQLSTDAPPWVAIHEVAHIITNKLEMSHKTAEDDFDGYKWASHGSVFVGIFAHLMEHYGLWLNLQECDFKGLEYFSETDLLEFGLVRHPDLTPRLSILLWTKWFCDVPRRAKKLIEDVKNRIDSFGIPEFTEIYGEPSRHVFPCGKDTDVIIKELITAIHAPSYTCFGIGEMGDMSWKPSSKKELKSIVRAKKGVKNVISEITDMCVDELFCLYEEIMVEDFIEWCSTNDEYRDWISIQED